MNEENVEPESGEVKIQLPVEKVVNQLHAKYGRQIGLLVQENAEAQAAINQLTELVAELQAELAALRGA